MSSVEPSTYRVLLDDVAAGLDSLRAPNGLFVSTVSTLPVGARCIVEVRGPRTHEVLRVDAVVVARRLPSGASASLAPGVVLQAAARGAVRTVATAPTSSTLELVRVLDGLLAGQPMTLDVAIGLRLGERVRVTMGTVKWPAVVSFAAKVESCAASQAGFRCVVRCDDDKDRAQLTTFVERMRNALSLQA